VNRDSIALAVLPKLVGMTSDYRAACAQAFAVADAFLDARSREPVVCIDFSSAENSAVAACYEMGRSLFEDELKGESRDQFVDAVQEWVAGGSLPNREEAAHALLGGLYDALMEALTPDTGAPADTPAMNGREGNWAPGHLSPEVDALIKMFQLPSVDASSTPDSPTKE